MKTGFSNARATLLALSATIAVDALVAKAEDPKSEVPSPNLVTGNVLLVDGPYSAPQFSNKPDLKTLPIGISGEIPSALTNICLLLERLDNSSSSVRSKMSAIEFVDSAREEVLKLKPAVMEFFGGEEKFKLIKVGLPEMDQFYNTIEAFLRITDPKQSEGEGTKNAATAKALLPQIAFGACTLLNNFYPIEDTLTRK